MVKKKHEKGSIKLANIILVLFLIGGMCLTYYVYKSSTFNGFTKSAQKSQATEFSKDEKQKYSNEKTSYKIDSSKYNDAMISKKIEVKSHTPYKVTCMVKTENVEPENNKKGAGAQISLSGTTQRSTALTGTHDWQKIEMIFNSEEKSQVEIGFRLGGYLGNCKGKAWFSDFTIQSGIADNSNNWKFACFIFQTTDVVLDNKEIKINVSQSDITDIKDTIKRFSSACEELSDGKMTADCDIYNIDTPITSLSYDNEFGYYVAPEDIETQIKDKIAESDYDHIFIIMRLGNDEYKNDIQINDWIGLGSMDYYGIGYSNIRLPNDSKSYIYKYNTRINTFPEEVFLHEFLHSLERTSTEYGYSIPALHDYKKYGYENEKLNGQKKWYTDYMNKNIQTQSGLIGLPQEVYKLKPAKSTNFEYKNELDYFKEPQNIIEDLNQMIKEIGTKLSQFIT